MLISSNHLTNWIESLLLSPGPNHTIPNQRNHFLEVIEERYMLASTLITNQLSLDQWYAVFGDSTSADAICDRLFHNAYKLELKGESMRKSST